MFPTITDSSLQFINVQKFTFSKFLWGLRPDFYNQLYLMYFHFKLFIFQSIFSDLFTVVVLDDRVQSIRWKQGEEFKPECLKKIVKFLTKIIIWGAVSVHGSRRWHIVKGTMNTKKYINVLTSRLLPQISDQFEQKPYIFQRHSAPCHKARPFTPGLKNKVKVQNWPGNLHESHREYTGPT